MISLLRAEGSFRQRVFALLGEARWCILAALILFLLGVVFGPLYPAPGLHLAEALFEMAQALHDKSLLQIAVAIFVRNLSAVTFALLLGVGLGLLPVAAALLNGWLAGVVIAEQPGALWMILPHGVFELPAVFIAWGLGIWCGLWVTAPAPFVALKTRLKKSLWLLLRLIVPLLAIAAFIEASLIAWLTS
ncbi:stage II sporulation protein M [Geoalkalibacter ferrihydriticus]|uniref:Stage II sporulation protein M n=1 Tax=Geoalkalibacter ferrihydriticus TaxID=392333 RepID=A0A1G9P423_9BACT|nr:stage II sporulation protein M [Geoalkalibacter ferrihydriticus]SDL93526.1 stage II sporulation protein M [Geoalkalibacter ferrihydriticus]